MMFPVSQDSYIVSLQDDMAIVSKFHNLSYMASINEPIKVEGYVISTTAYPLHKPMKDISEEDIVELLKGVIS